MAEFIYALGQRIALPIVSRHEQERALLAQYLDLVIALERHYDIGAFVRLSVYVQLVRVNRAHSLFGCGRVSRVVFALDLVALVRFGRSFGRVGGRLGGGLLSRFFGRLLGRRVLGRFSRVPGGCFGRFFNRLLSRLGGGFFGRLDRRFNRSLDYGLDSFRLVLRLVQSRQYFVHVQIQLDHQRVAFHIVLFDADAAPLLVHVKKLVFVARLQRVYDAARLIVVCVYLRALRLELASVFIIYMSISGTANADQ